jgi:hypothetical protein
MNLVSIGLDERLAVSSALRRDATRCDDEVR